ncbi:MAG: AbrB/MazE/SpoVT family DNA-binding domain-containing protein [Deltaproteobacteria bacterium]|nr:AbrB/MazE/SpoVT family DNA-binding domain-containing protein [Deltaproteobacteria bacterium]
MVSQKASVSKLTEKGQATIPAEIRRKLGLLPGDTVGFELEGEKVVLRRIQPFDYAYHKALSTTLSEWDDAEDDEGYRDL